MSDKPKLSKKDLKLKKKLEKERAQELEDQKNERLRLEREIKYSKKSMSRGWQEWESWCETNVRDELRDEVQVAKQNVERLKDKTDHAIQITFEHKKHADEQYERNLHSHLEIIDHLTDLYKMFMNYLGRGFEDQRDEMLKEFYKDCIRNERMSLENLNQLKNSTHLLKILHESNLEKVAQDHQDRKDILNADCVVKRWKLDENACAIIQKHIQEIQEAFEAFRTAWSEKKYRMYLDREKKLNTADKNQEKDKEKIKELEIIVDSWNQELVKLEQDHLEKISVLKSEVNYYTNVLKKMEENLKFQLDGDDKKLQLLCFLGNQRQKLLKKEIDRAQAVLGLSKVCQKFEDQTIRYLEENAQGKPPYDNNYMLSYTDIFYAKISKVELYITTMKNMKIRLSEENQKLKSKIEEKCHQEKVAGNIRMLRISSSPTIQIPRQISSHIPQIINSIKSRNPRQKICDDCRKISHYNLP